MGYVFDAMNRANSDRSGDDPVTPFEADETLLAEPDDAPTCDDLTEAVVESAEPEWVDADALDAALEYEGILEREDADDRRTKQSLMAIETAQRPGAASSQIGPTFTIPAENAAIQTQLDLDAMDDRLVALTHPASVMAEEYRSIRTSILARWEQRRNLVHLITSASPQEGKTITSLNLGLIFAELHNRKILVIEADLRLPQFARLLALPDSPGLVGLLEGQADLSDVIHAVGDNGLHVIPCGPRANDRAVQLLSSNTMVTILSSLRQRYDHVIIDTPPVADLADAGILAGMSDDVLLIARMNHTPKTLIEQAVRTLASYNAPVSGMLATDHPRSRGRYYYRKYGYRYRDNYRHYHAKAS